MTQTGTVATFGGVNFPAVSEIMDGFALGVAYYNEMHKAKVELLGWDIQEQSGLFTGDFVNTEEGRRMAEMLMDEGADIILPVAGGVGVGAAAAVQAVEEGAFSGGMHLGTLENGGVSIAPFYNLDVLVNPRVKTDLN